MRDGGPSLDPKSALQHLVQARWHQPPDYVTVAEQAEEEGRRFVVEVRVSGEMLGRGSGSSKRAPSTRLPARPTPPSQSTPPPASQWGLSRVRQAPHAPGIQKLRAGDHLRVRFRRHRHHRPNGSGKSNVADAVRWVLGEQGLRLLAARKQEDVIFAGAGDRPPLGMAEVTLTLDNSDGWLPLDYSEIQIGRRPIVTATRNTF